MERLLGRSLDGPLNGSFNGSLIGRPSIPLRRPRVSSFERTPCGHPPRRRNDLLAPCRRLKLRRVKSIRVTATTPIDAGTSSQMYLRLGNPKMSQKPRLFALGTIQPGVHGVAPGFAASSRSPLSNCGERCHVPSSATASMACTTPSVTSGLAQGRW